MKILMVGAGAVGQVFGWHLHRGGADVRYLVKPQHLSECESGFLLYPLALSSRFPQGVRFTPRGTITSIAEVSRESWDIVMLCISSAALRTPWFDELVRAIGESATLVTLQPSLGDQEFILARFPRDRLVTGMISLAAYHAPMPGESPIEPGTAFWFPPFSPTPFSGPDARLRQVLNAFRSGKMPVSQGNHIEAQAAFPGALLMCLVAELQSCGWSFRALCEKHHLDGALGAAREAFGAIEKSHGFRVPLRFRLVNPLLVRLALSLAPRAVPFDLELFFKTHFTKVGSQTRLALAEYEREAAKHGLPAKMLQELRARAFPDSHRAESTAIRHHG